MKPLFLLVLALAGCREGTSVLLRVRAAGVDIPTDVASVRIRVTNPELDPNAVTFDSPLVSLCGAVPTNECSSLPLSVALHPGPNSPGALVRAEVSALDASGTTVIEDAAEFHFTDGQQATLDFFLAKACLMSQCAASGQACGPDGGCVTPVPMVEPSGAIDMASPSTGGTVTRVAELQGYTFPGMDPMFIVPGPPDPADGDLLVGIVSAGAVPAGWTTVYESPPVRLLYRRVRANDTSYAFPAATGLGSSWLLVSYRGVATVVPGSGFSPTLDGRYAFASQNVTRPGSVLTTWLSGGECTINGHIALYGTSDIVMDESSALPAGPTGARSAQCASGNVGPFGAQILLAP